MAADALPFCPMQGRVQPMPDAFQAELAKMIEHRLPGREVGGEVTPGAAGTQDVEDGVQDAPQRVRARSAACRQGGEGALDARPLRVTEVARIAYTHAYKRRLLRHDG